MDGNDGKPQDPGSPAESPGSPPSPAAPAPAPPAAAPADAGSVPQASTSADKATAEAKAGLSLGLVAVCVALWVGAFVIFFWNFDETKRDYYWGNIKQALDDPSGGHVDREAVAALVAMGPAVVPSCKFELDHQFEPLYRCVVIEVLGGVPGPESRLVLDRTVREDLDPRVKANALLALRTRARKDASEKPALVALAEDRLKNEREASVRSVAGLVCGESGEKTPEVTALLVHLLRYVPRGDVRKDTVGLLQQLAPGSPKVDPEPAPADAIAQVMALEHWCQANGIAIVGSPLTAAPAAAPVSSGAASGPDTTAVDSAAPVAAPAGTVGRAPK